MSADPGDVDRHSFTAAVVTSLDRVVEETIDSVIVILIVLSGIDDSGRRVRGEVSH